MFKTASAVIRRVYISTLGMKELRIQGEGHNSVGDFLCACVNWDVPLLVHDNHCGPLLIQECYAVHEAFYVASSVDEQRPLRAWVAGLYPQAHRDLPQAAAGRTGCGQVSRVLPAKHKFVEIAKLTVCTCS